MNKLNLYYCTLLLFLLVNTCQNPNSNHSNSQDTIDEKQQILKKDEKEKIAKDCFTRGVIAMSSEKTLVQAVSEFNCSLKYSDSYKKESLENLISVFSKLNDTVRYRKHVKLLDELDNNIKQ